MKSKKVSFTNEQGIELSGRLQLPLDRKPRQFAIFAHCFTCGKDLKSVRNISLALSQNGFGVLRFDFTGLGQSGGEFANTTFSSNIEDLQAAARFLKEYYKEPVLLIGHSLGGTAVLMAGSKMPSVRAITTIGAPCEPEHVLKLLREDMNEIRTKGRATVNLAGREFDIKSQFVEDLENHGMDKILESEGMRGKSVLVLHSPQDKIVGIENAEHIYRSARHPKSFVSLDGADHLLSAEKDSRYTGNLIAAWVQRYLDEEEDAEVEIRSDEQVMARLDEGPFLTEILAGAYHLLSDEPKGHGGNNLGPTPYELLAAGLGACTTMTIKMYADRKEWPLEEVKVRLNYDNKHKEDCEGCEDENRRIGRFERIIELKGNLDEKQRQRLLEIANKCPVHKTMSKGVNISTELREEKQS